MAISCGRRRGRSWFVSNFSVVLYMKYQLTNLLVKGQHESESESESSDADEDPVDFDTADPARIDSLIKKAKAKAGKKSKKKEKKKAQTEVRLSELSSISGGGGQSPLTSRGGFSRGGKGGGGGGGKKYHGGKFANKANKRSK
jgi:uncharacterized membrane protein YgcG